MRLYSDNVIKHSLLIQDGMEQDNVLFIHSLTHSFIYSFIHSSIQFCFTFCLTERIDLFNLFFNSSI